MQTIYLAGSINGTSYEEATSWREELGLGLTIYGYRVLDPMRFKQNLKGVEKIEDHNTPFKPEYILARDLHDIQESDLIVANMDTLGKLPMIGTLMELGIAHNKDKKVLLINVPEEYEKHPFFIEFRIIKEKEIQSIIGEINAENFRN